jgi:hypothetical protein
MDADHRRMLSIFMPQAINQVDSVADGKMRFVHYTSAEVAFQIIRNKQFWMRRSSVMNDFLEIEHGLECLQEAWRDPNGSKFKALINSIHRGLGDEVERKFNGWLPEFRNETFLTSLSEHDESEDQLGRLSMWRAYGGPAGVALVVNSTPFGSELDVLHIYSSPVRYIDVSGFKQDFIRLLEALEENLNFLKERSSDEIEAYAFQMLRFGVLCTKHPGFAEEREWRVVYNPGYAKSDKLEESLELVRGIPQLVVKVPLRDVEEEGLVGLEIPLLIERIIVGPTQFPDVIRDTFVRLLVDAGVENAAQRVVVSDIPLRT